MFLRIYGINSDDVDPELLCQFRDNEENKISKIKKLRLSTKVRIFFVWDILPQTMDELLIEFSDVDHVYGQAERMADDLNEVARIIGEDTMLFARENIHRKDGQSRIAKIAVSIPTIVRSKDGNAEVSLEDVEGREYEWEQSLPEAGLRESEQEEQPAFSVAEKTIANASVAVITFTRPGCSRFDYECHGELAPIFNRIYKTVVIIDLTRVDWIDSVAIGTLVTLSYKTARTRQRLGIIGASQEVIAPIKALRVDAILPIFDTAEEAVRELTKKV